MKTSLAGAMEIIAHEGIVTSRYKDSVGVWTVGVGHTAAAGAPDPSRLAITMTVKEAIDLFRRDLAKYERGVEAAFTVPLKQHEFDAAVSFHFNTGAISTATWVKQFNQGRRAEAIASIMSWSKPKEIIGRRKKEQALFSTGVYSSDGFATVYPADAKGNVQWAKGKRVDLRKEYGLLPPQDAPSPSPAPKPTAGGKGVVIVAGAGALGAAIVGWWEPITAFFRGIFQ